MAKKNQNQLRVFVSDKELDTFLSAVDLLPNENDHVFTAPIHKLYEKLSEQVTETHPVVYPALTKDNVIHPFKKEEEFTKSLMNFFKRELMTRTLEIVSKHPTWAVKLAANKIEPDYMDIFNRCLTIAYAELSNSILLQKIERGMYPLNEKLF